MDPLTPVVLGAAALVVLVGLVLRVRGTVSSFRALSQALRDLFRQRDRASKNPGPPTDDGFRDVGDPPRGDRPDPYA